MEREGWLMWKSTTIIYVYIYIIIALILFDIFYTLNEKLQARRGKQKLEKYKNMVLEEIARLQNNKNINEKHRRRLAFHLRRINNLLIYQEAIRILKLESRYQVDEYLVLYSSVFQIFAHLYRHKDSIYKAFFASFLAKYYPFYLHKNTILDEAIMKYVEDKSIYCRENAMLYFYERSSVRLVVNALKKIDENHLYYNHKLLSNDLLKFKGNKKELAKTLFEEFANFSLSFQISIINYLRFSKMDLKEELLRMLTSKEYDKEVNLAIIRYFGKEIHQEVLPYLLQILETEEKQDIEYKIITCQMIGAYESSRVKNALISCISDTNWYVRKNAAKTLSRMKLSNREQQKIEKITDCYGKEMLDYTVLVKKAKKKKEEVLV